MKKLGVIGGMGPLASVDFLRRLIQKTSVLGDGDHIHTLLDNNPRIPDRTEYICNGGISPLEEIVSSALTLERMGADLLVMPCNTAHYLYDDILSSISLPFINMIDSTLASIKKGSSVGLMATPGTYEGRIYERSAHKYHIHIVLPDDEVKLIIRDIIYGIKKGIPIDSYYIREGFSRVLHHFRRKGVDKVILGCTELSLIPPPIEYYSFTVDPVDILIDEVIFLIQDRNIKKNSSEINVN